MLTILQGLVPPQFEESDEPPAVAAEPAEEEEDREPLLDEHAEDVDRDDPLRHLSAEHLSRLYVFALAWSMGALLELNDRKKYDQFLRDSFTQLDLPTSRYHPEATVFDFVVSPAGESVAA